MSHVLNVLLTVDTEIGHPLSREWLASALEREWRRDIDGVTPDGEFGIGYQMDVLSAHGLKATFFVESLFATAVEQPALLQRLVRHIDGRGHDVQLHVHPEWLARMSEPVVPSRGQNLRDFSAAEQTTLIAECAAALRAAGAPQLAAFRAGNYGANLDTLRALRANGVWLDTSYSVPHLRRPCAIELPDMLVHPSHVEGVVEFPVGSFEDWPGHYRPLQLCACSASELTWALREAWRRRWRYLVLIFHSFELLRRPCHIDEPAKPNKIVIQRFTRLCRFLAEHQTRFRTRVFSEIDPAEIPPPLRDAPLESRLFRTAWRYFEQLQSRRA